MPCCCFGALLLSGKCLHQRCGQVHCRARDGWYGAPCVCRSPAAHARRPGAPHARQDGGCRQGRRGCGRGRRLCWADGRRQDGAERQVWVLTPFYGGEWGDGRTALNVAKHSCGVAVLYTSARISQQLVLVRIFLCYFDGTLHEDIEKKEDRGGHGHWR